MGCMEKNHAEAGPNGKKSDDKATPNTEDARSGSAVLLGHRSGSLGIRGGPFFLAA